MDASGVVILRLAEHHAITVEQHVVDSAIEEVIAGQLDVEPTLEEVFADAELEHRISAVYPDIRASIAVGVHIEVGLQEPVAGQRDEVA